MLTTTPPAAPAKATSSPSTKYWRPSCHRAAPSATRIAVSLARVTDLASSKPATLAHVISSSAPAAPNSSSSTGRMSLTVYSSRLTTRAV